MLYPLSKLYITDVKDIIQHGHSGKIKAIPNAKHLPFAAESAESTEDVEDLPAYPEGGYWSVDPSVRLRMLLALVHDALATNPIRLAFLCFIPSSLAFLHTRYGCASKLTVPKKFRAPKFMMGRVPPLVAPALLGSASGLQKQRSLKACF